MKLAEGDVAKCYIEDFEMNGEKSGFILTEKRVTEKKSKFSLWFVSKDEVKILKKDVLAVNNSTLELIKNHDSVHVLFREVQFTLNDKFVATLYGVYNGKAKLLFSKNNIRIDIDDNKNMGRKSRIVIMIILQKLIWWPPLLLMNFIGMSEKVNIWSMAQRRSLKANF